MHLMTTVESTEFDNNNMLNRKKLALNRDKICLQPSHAKKLYDFRTNGQFNQMSLSFGG